MRPSFLGWRMVAVAFLADFVAVGFLFYSFGVFLPFVEEGMGWTRAELSLALACSNVAGAVAAPLVGRALDAVAVRRVMATGALLMAAGFALLSRAEALWQFLAVFASFLAVGSMCMGHLSSAKLVANWFDARRGTALGVATMGISLSGLVMPPVATWLILRLGWRGAFLVYAAGTLGIIAPVAWRFVVSRPEDVGLHPDGAPAEARAARGAQPERPWATRDIVRSAAFWGIVLPFALGFFANSAILTHLVPHARHLGISAYAAASLLSVVAGAGVVGKLAFGAIADRAGPRTAVLLSMALQLAGVQLLLRLESYPALVGTGLVFGFGMGGMVPLHGTLAGAAFGRLSFGKVMGLMRPFQVPIHALGIPFAGWVFERTGSYAPAFRVFTGAYALAVVALALSARRTRRGAPPASPGHEP